MTNLQAKVESLTTTNALMKEDLSIAKNNILSLHEENRQLKKELGIEIKDTNEVRYVSFLSFPSSFPFSFSSFFFFDQIDSSKGEKRVSLVSEWETTDQNH